MRDEITVAQGVAEQKGWEFLRIYRGYAVFKREHDYCYHTLTSLGIVSGHYDYVSFEAIKRVLDIEYFEQAFKRNTVLSIDGCAPSAIWTLKDRFDNKFNHMFEEMLLETNDFMAGWIDNDLDICFVGFNLGSIVSIDDVEYGNSHEFNIVFHDLENIVKVKIVTYIIS